MEMRIRDSPGLWDSSEWLLISSRLPRLWDSWDSYLLYLKFCQELWYYSARGRPHGRNLKFEGEQLWSAAVLHWNHIAQKQHCEKKMEELKLDSISNLIVRLLLWMIRFESRRIWRICKSHHSLQYWGGSWCMHLEKVQQTGTSGHWHCRVQYGTAGYCRALQKRATWHYRREYPIFFLRKQAVL